LRVLVTGFEPFGGETENASATAVAALDGVVTAVLPVEYGVAGDRLLALVEKHRPDVVVCVGESAEAATVLVEAVAHNLDDARIPDNAGRQPHGVPIRDGGPETLSPSFDVEALAAASGARVSHDAGRFVCNHVFYRALDELSVPALFVHVPAERDGSSAAVLRAIVAALETERDVIRFGRPGNQNA
jgi:pyroglutamyl-peptidase